MRTLEDVKPKRGLSVPLVTVLDDGGDLLEADQRSLVRHVIQDGYGADVVFAGGTTGEWDALSAPVMRQAVAVSIEEVLKENSRLGLEAGSVEAWAGVTSHNPIETLRNLELAIQSGAHAAVLAPLSIRGIDDPVRFVARDVADLLDSLPRRIPIYLYDNADIAVDPKVRHFRTWQVKALSRLDFVRGIKVSASKKVLGNYTKAAESFRDRGEFGIYIGDALLVFDLFRPRSGWLGVLDEHWQRRRLRGSLPVGVVSGPANVLPREWARAWQVCTAGDLERMELVQNVLTYYRAETRAAVGRRSIACLKRALFLSGVISSPRLAKGTPGLALPDLERFDSVWREVIKLSREKVGDPWVTKRPIVDGVSS